ncbi:hypothetical protein [Methylosinus sp. PW1]|uniref:hypothetical protein n=1 Tax=Methylosinus sp. PW1 TaxID=107636 RepID=UPI00055B5B3F|nr:hypothetical protein [Methylosinus sp. PW1]
MLRPSEIIALTRLFPSSEFHVPLHRISIPSAVFVIDMENIFRDASLSPAQRDTKARELAKSHPGVADFVQDVGVALADMAARAGTA